MSVFKMRVQIGTSRLQPCSFTTFTYRVDGPGRENAESVKKDWKEFWRRWKKSGQKSLEWLRVVELTKRKQPHLHVVMGPVDGQIRCYGRRAIRESWFLARGECGCLSHRLSKVWHEVTGDSWVVHTVPCLGGKGSGGYMAKYMVKGSLVRAELEAMGFKRRWSRSRGFPGGGLLQLRTSVEEGWRRVEIGWTAPPGADGKPWGAIDLVDRVGDDLALALASRNRVNAEAAAIVRRVGHATDDS